MLTETQVKRWASLMLMSALRGDVPRGSIAQQLCMLRSHHGAGVFEKLIEEILVEAGRLGPGHCKGTLYHAEKTELTESIK